MKVLIVDDSVFAQKFMEKTIKNGLPEAEVKIAASGEDAYELFSMEAFDVIVTDLLMPGMGGQMLIKMIRQTDEKVKIIVVSADVQYSVQNEVMDMGVAAFIKKPLNDEKSAYLLTMLGEASHA